MSSSNSVYISFVYGSPNKQKRIGLWDMLIRSIPSRNYLWVVIVDFNAILSSSKKSGGITKGRRCPYFGEFMDKADLHDLGYRGPPFTSHRGWVEHLNFGKFVEDNWGYSGDMLDTLSTFTPNLKEWNKLVYGYITSRKRVLIKEFTRIQKLMDFSGTNHLVQMELKIRHELENVLRQEELFWKQKARCGWLLLGNRNTKFFHARTLRQRKNSRISAIRNDCGDRIYNLKDIEVDASKFFQNLYGESPRPMRVFPPNDLVIFSKADMKHCRLIKDILDSFCDLSGYKINARKMNIFFSKGVDATVADSISFWFGFQNVQNLGHYLGVPLLHKRDTSMILDGGTSWADIGNASTGGLREIEMDSGFLVLIDILESARSLKLNFRASLKA
ncbi:hypothetical protein J1N35_044343 [Gossypium stocksii]|uniref:Reverse transcriptase domain-containing protein n=1 Tax=Gossypium stocksii TaxID=47602 RepID=A0A9D3U920_9ROSI|nr:hypothetical protein J1N35_044343 [Gossypium stocksii]